MNHLKKYIENLSKEEAAENFAKWFDEHGIRDEDGEPKVLYIGTTSDFTRFDITKTNPDSHWGQGFYATDNSEDASNNYATVKGPDRLLAKGHIEEYLQNDFIGFVEKKFNDLIEQETDDELIVLFNKVYQALLNDEEVDDEEFDEVLDFLSDRALSIDNEGFMFALYAAPRKMLDVEEKVFEDSISYSNLDPLVEYLSDYSIGHEVKISIECMTSELDTEVTINLEKMIEFIDEAANNYDMEDDDYDEVIQYVTKYFADHDNEITFEISLSGEIYDLRDALKQLFEDNYYYSDRDKLDSIFSDIIVSSQESGEPIKVQTLLDFEDLFYLLTDAYIPVESPFPEDMHGARAILAEGFRRMGYDAIKMDASIFEGMKHVDGTNHYIFFNSNIIKSSIGNNGEYSLSSPDILHRVADKIQSHKMMSHTAAVKLINDIEHHYKAMPKIHLYTDESSIPKDILINNPNLDTCSGWYDLRKNSVHIFLPNIVDKQDLEKTLCHEVFGHMSMREILGNKYENTMLKVFNYYDKKGTMEDIKTEYTQRYNLDLNTNKDKALLGEEMMAKAIEKHGFNQFPLKSIVMGAIKSAIRKVVPQLKMNNTDIQYLIYKSHENLFDVKQHRKVSKPKHN